jgi:hypothetical protein
MVVDHGFVYSGFVVYSGNGRVHNGRVRGFIRVDHGFVYSGFVVYSGNGRVRNGRVCGFIRDGMGDFVTWWYCGDFIHSGFGSDGWCFGGFIRGGFVGVVGGNTVLVIDVRSGVVGGFMRLLFVVGLLRRDVVGGLIRLLFVVGLLVDVRSFVGSGFVGVSFLVGVHGCGLLAFAPGEVVSKCGIIGFNGNFNVGVSGRGSVCGDRFDGNFGGIGSYVGSFVVDVRSGFVGWGRVDVRGFVGSRCFGGCLVVVGDSGVGCVVDVRDSLVVWLSVGLMVDVRSC